jgi:alpha-glucosidase
MKRIAISVTLISVVLSAVCTAGGVQAAEQPLAKAKQSATAKSAPWWQRAVFYQIYPRSFADADGNGMGDLAGITSKLDYLKSIGVGALWITPCFPSPQVDFGYDVSDYKAIAPEYGTMADFDKLVAEAKKRDIKVCLDLVLNHTSDKHAWFQESKSSRTNAKRDWYVWNEGKNGQPPNNWLALFGGSAWQFDPATKQFYYHFFYPEQPDLNWRNPQVKAAMWDAAEFWLKRGAAGYRLDAVNTIYEDPALADNPIVAGKTNRFGEPEMINANNYLQPGLHETLQELRAVVDKFPQQPVLIGETTDAKNIEQLAKWYGPSNNEIQLPMNFMFAYIDKLSAPEFRKMIGDADANPANGWPVYLFSNHDVTRAYNRYGDGENNDQIAKLLATMLYTLRGTPIVYYGEELGMENNDPKRVEDVKDPIGKLGWPREKGRDGERTPMQWTAGPNAGFSKATPWLPVPESYKTHNVEVESKDPNSVLSYYRSLAALRSAEAALATTGAYQAVNGDDPHVLSYVRKAPNGETILVALNMTPEARVQKYDLGKNTGRILLSSLPSAPAEADLTNVTLEPYQVIVAKL